MFLDNHKSPDTNQSFGSYPKELIVIAGGRGSRLREMFKDEYLPPFTKHTLPLPEKGGSLIGAIVEKSSGFFDTISLSLSENNASFISPMFADRENINIGFDNRMIGPMFPPLQKILDHKSRVYTCCGDIYSNFAWNEFEEFHNNHRNPVSILVSKSFQSTKASCFDIADDNTIAGWTRKDLSDDDDYINIGAYIIDSAPQVARIAEDLIELGNCKEDMFFNKCIQQGIISAYKTSAFSCNVNTPDTYFRLLNKLKHT